MDYFYYNTDVRSIRHEPRPRYPVLIQQGFAAVGGDYEKYGGQFRQLNPGDVLLMYENGVGVVAIGEVQEKWDGASHSEPRYYHPDETVDLTGGTSEYRIAVDWFLDLSAAPVSVTTLHDRIGFTAPQAVQKIGKGKLNTAQLVAELLTARSLLPGEIERPKQYVEGAVVPRWVNAYERNTQARDECKKSQGTACAICGFDFGQRYGPEFAGFIHVHHLVPLYEVKAEYQVSPETDLVPVCPNCHAAIHHGGQTRTPDAVRALLKASGGA
jgi:hypothetical protein